MNFNSTLECRDCRHAVNIRLGMSNRDLQPLKFACNGCGSQIGITVRMTPGANLDNVAMEHILRSSGERAPSFNLSKLVSMKLTGAREIQASLPFNSDMDFLDLHLDFPVGRDPYIPGNTPYMVAVRKAGGDKTEFHKYRL